MTTHQPPLAQTMEIVYHCPAMLCRANGTKRRYHLDPPPLCSTCGEKMVKGVQRSEVAPANESGRTINIDSFMREAASWEDPGPALAVGRSLK